MAASLNLSNEVVKLRAEVKRVKVFVIRKLTRNIDVLKKKKGNEAVLEKNKRRVARLHEEIRELRTLAPDTITKTALRKDIDFNKVCENNNASLSERAIARVASHPDFSKKILNLKKAVEAFNAERKTDAKKDKKTKKESKDIKQQSGSEPGAEDLEEADQKDNTAKHDEDAPITATEKSLETEGAPPEVTMMRTAVKKLRMLIIRKLSQDISSLKKMKGEESDLKVYKESAAKLQEEVQVLRHLVPDHVTTRALQEKIKVEEVLQDPESSPQERATARITTHPRFIMKLQAVRESIEGEKMRAALTEEENMVREVEVAEYSESDNDSDGDSDVEEEESESEQDSNEEEDDEEEDNDDKDEEDEEEEENEDDIKEKLIEQPSNVIKESDVVKPLEEDRSPTMASALKAKELATDEAVQAPAVSHTVPTNSKKPATPAAQPFQPEAEKTENKQDEDEESDLEPSDDEQEKEYFDDSTEERFHKQSSLSEESDEDDFFLGKVSKLKKKKRSSSGAEKKSEPRTTGESQTAKETADKSREFKMQSVFCTALSESGGASKSGQHRGSKPPHFQNQRKQPEGDVKPSWFKSQGSGADRRPSGAGARGPGPRPMGAGEARPGKPEFGRQQNQTTRGAPGKPFRPPQQAMHPSWEASRKRKEQQSQITAFQGKKIKFDDDDD